MWYQDFGMELLSWPAFSLNQLTIEKLRGILARKIYDQENPLTEDIVELKKRIKKKKEYNLRKRILKTKV